MTSSETRAEAIGLIECASFPAAVAASDAMLKNFSIQFLGFVQTGQGLVTTKIAGDIESVQKAMEIGVEVAEQVGQVVSLHVIAEPHPALQSYLRGEKQPLAR